MHLNIEIKARCPDPNRVRKLLRAAEADFRGTDHQVDTYFEVARGRLKLRQGNIEQSLIYYERGDLAGPKSSRVFLYPTTPESDQLRELLTAALGQRKVVDKRREIYFIENVKFHIDEVKGLGNFVEIEAIDTTGAIGENKLREQCDYYLRYLAIAPEQLIEHSYSDLL